ncbi:MAG: hypothetical protein IPN17_23595 [Deltaproteobacteria bacterium]|nr:hypothetical protein [Deltaproteobacteria bacterium]
MPERARSVPRDRPGYGAAGPTSANGPSPVPTVAAHAFSVTPPTAVVFHAVS